MNELVKAIPFSLLLRSWFSGVFFVAAYRLTLSGPSASEPLDDLIKIAPASLVCGFVIYNIYRALVFPLLEFALDSAPGKWVLDQHYFLIKKATVDNLLTRWGRVTIPQAPHKRREDAINGWADSAHLLYASGVCVLFGIWCKVLFVRYSHWPVAAMAPDYYFEPLVGLAVLFFLGGFASDCRLRVLEARVNHGWAPPTMANTKANPQVGTTSTTKTLPNGGVETTTEIIVPGGKITTVTTTTPPASGGAPNTVTTTTSP